MTTGRLGPDREASGWARRAPCRSPRVSSLQGSLQLLAASVSLDVKQGATQSCLGESFVVPSGPVHSLGVSWDWAVMPDPSGMRETRQLISPGPLQWTAAFIGLRDPCSQMNAAPCRTARPAKPRSLVAIGCQPSVSVRGELPTITRGRLKRRTRGQGLPLPSSDVGGRSGHSVCCKSKVLLLRHERLTEAVTLP